MTINLKMSLLAAFFLLCGNIQGQVLIEQIEMENEPMPLSIAAEAPAFKSCKELSGKELSQCFFKQLYAYIEENIKYPTEHMTDSIETRVYVTYLIDQEGKVRVIKTYCRAENSELFEAEALRLIENLPKLEPARHNGEAIIVKHEYPIKFSMK